MLYYKVDCLEFLCFSCSIKFESDEDLNHLLPRFDEYFSLRLSVNQLYILVSILRLDEYFIGALVMQDISPSLD